MHVSTAFVHGSATGTASCPLPQELADLGGRNPESLYRSARCAPPEPASFFSCGSSRGSSRGSATSGGGGGGSVPGNEAANAIADLGYPNTYTFTKALGEHLLVRALGIHNRKVEKAKAKITAMRGEGGGDGVADKGGVGGRDSETRSRASGGGGGGSGGVGVGGGSSRCRLRLRVVRPSIVGPSWAFPWPGWTGDQPSTVTGKWVARGCFFRP